MSRKEAVLTAQRQGKTMIERAVQGRICALDLLKAPCRKLMDMGVFSRRRAFLDSPLKESILISDIMPAIFASPGSLLQIAS